MISCWRDLIRSLSLSSSEQAENVHVAARCKFLNLEINLRLVRERLSSHDPATTQSIHHLLSGFDHKRVCVGVSTLAKHKCRLLGLESLADDPFHFLDRFAGLEFLTLKQAGVGILRKNGIEDHLRTARFFLPLTFS